MMAQPCDNTTTSGEGEHLIFSSSLSLQRRRGMWVWIPNALTAPCCQGHHTGKGYGQAGTESQT